MMMSFSGYSEPDDELVITDEVGRSGNGSERYGARDLASRGQDSSEPPKSHPYALGFNDMDGSTPGLGNASAFKTWIRIYDGDAKPSLRKEIFTYKWSGLDINPLTIFGWRDHGKYDDMWIQHTK